MGGPPPPPLGPNCSNICRAIWSMRKSRNSTGMLSSSLTSSSSLVQRLRRVRRDPPSDPPPLPPLLEVELERDPRVVVPDGPAVELVLAALRLVLAGGRAGAEAAPAADEADAEAPASASSSPSLLPPPPPLTPPPPLPDRAARSRGLASSTKLPPIRKKSSRQMQCPHGRATTGGPDSSRQMGHLDWTYTWRAP